MLFFFDLFKSIPCPTLRTLSRFTPGFLLKTALFAFEDSHFRVTSRVKGY